MSEGPFVFGPFGPEDMPEELKNILNNLLTGVSLNQTGLAHDEHEDEIHPAEEQLNYGPGDLVAVSQGPDQQRIGRTLEMGVIVDPAEHAETYPDWEDRLMKSYMLLNYYTVGEDDGNLYGWFPRSTLIKFEKEHWDQMLVWLKSGNVNNEAPPSWMICRHHEVMNGLAEKNPDKRFPLVSCPTCDGLGVVITMTRTEKDAMVFGYDPNEEGSNVYPWKPGLYKVAQISHEEDIVGHWKCHRCGAEGELDEETGLWAK